MRWVDEFRDGALAHGIVASIRRRVEPGRRYAIMEFCGGHTHAVARYGLTDLLPPEIDMVHGPGCPVCVLPVGRLDMAIDLAANPAVILCTYADLMRVPGSGTTSLYRAKAQGADVRMVYSPLDVLRIARDHPGREVVFLAVGFETTTPPTAMAIKQARAEGLGNFSVLCNHVLTPAAMRAIVAVEGDGLRIDGFIGPGHVSMIIGAGPYEEFTRDHRKPVVIAGFEPLDLLRAIDLLVGQINDGAARVENEYGRACPAIGNLKAQAAVAETMTRRDSFEWRGLQSLPHSALAIADVFAEFDAERRFGLVDRQASDHKGCECASIVRGVKKPPECKLFGRACTPESPMGACMVSAEGACAAYWTYGRFRDAQKVPA